MEKKPNISIFVLFLLCSLISVSGISAIILPHPSSWVIPDDCEQLEGIVIDRVVNEKYCLMEGVCTGDTTLTIEPDDGSDNKTLHVSPLVYHSYSIGSRYDNYYCE